MRVLFANNYDMTAARAGWLAGRYPGHHLYGTAELGDGFDVVDLPMRSGMVGDRLRRAVEARLGDADQQLGALRRLRRDTVIYGAQGEDLAGLGLLRALGLLRVPVVGVIHGKSGLGRLDRIWLNGFDRVITMCVSTRDGLTDAGVSPERIVALPWGPDLDFPGFTAAAEDISAGVVSTGKSGRDLPLLLRALAAEDIPGVVYGERDRLSQQLAIPDAVEIVPQSQRSSSASASYDHVLDNLRRAAVVAIPLRKRYPLHGLTEIADAVACGKPVIVTRAPYFDFDVEEIGCGWWVEADDEDGWRQSLREAMSDIPRLVAMGQRGRGWAAEHWNAKLFADGVRQVLGEAC